VIEFKGACKGVRLERRGKKDSHICVRLLTEDDEMWYPAETSFSSYWLDELIKKLQEAKTYMENNCEKDEVWGYKFPCTKEGEL
jgi:hypothetical protein